MTESDKRSEFTFGGFSLEFWLIQQADWLKTNENAMETKRLNTGSSGWFSSPLAKQPLIKEVSDPSEFHLLTSPNDFSL